MASPKILRDIRIISRSSANPSNHHPPPTMHKHDNMYLARSGELAVLSELLSRGFDAARPEVDVGEDLIVTIGASVHALQIKTATAKERRDGSSFAAYHVRSDQLLAKQPLADDSVSARELF